jgi:hypothetical protein
MTFSVAMGRITMKEMSKGARVEWTSVRTDVVGSVQSGILETLCPILVRELCGWYSEIQLPTSGGELRQNRTVHEIV